MVPTPFKVVISGRNHFLVRMSGPINESADFGPVRFAKRPPIEIDMDEVTLINSVGLRSFGNWVCSLENPSIDFSNVPKFVVDQFNMIPGLVPPRSKVLSFYVPYFNAEKELEKRVLYRTGLEFKAEGGNPNLVHPKVTDTDGNKYEIDVMPGKYFEFLKKYG